MKRNPHFYDHDRLRIHRIVWLEVEEYTSTLQLYRAAELDWTGQNTSLPQEYLPLLAKKDDFRSVEYLGTYWYEINVTRPPLDDVRVRRALNLAIDKRVVVDKVTQGGQKPATHVVPDITGLGYAEAAAADRARGASPFADPDAEHDPEEARRLLAEAGYPVVGEGEARRCDGLPPIEILYNTSEGHRKIAVAIQDMWRRHLGISATLRNEEWKVMLKNLRDGNFQIARMGWIADYNHPQTFLDNFLSFSPNNRTGWKDAAFDDLMRRAAATADTRASMDLYRQAEKRAVDGVSRLPIYFYTKSTMVKPWLQGFSFNGRNQMLPKWMWIDEDWRARAAASPGGRAPVEPAIPVPVAPPPGRF
jgi:oligopeptide transport system substrate-binding protein